MEPQRMLRRSDRTDAWRALRTDGVHPDSAAWIYVRAGIFGSIGSGRRWLRINWSALRKHESTLVSGSLKRHFCEWVNRAAISSSRCWGGFDFVAAFSDAQSVGGGGNEHRQDAVRATDG